MRPICLMGFNTVATVLALLAVAGSASAHQGASVAVGRAPGVTSLQGSLAWEPALDERHSRWLDWTGAGLRIELGANVWQGESGAAARGTLLGVTALPLLRWSFSGPVAGRTFVEFGVGPRLWSGTNIKPGHRFGTAFEFGTIVGAGLRISGYDLFVRVEHTSNAGIRQPNPGINFVQIGVAWRSSRKVAHQSSRPPPA